MRRRSGAGRTDFQARKTPPALIMTMMRDPHRRWRAVLSHANYRRPPTTMAALMLAISIVVGSALRLRAIWTLRLWGDELFNYSLSQGTWLTLLKRAALDMAHPPLFYLLLKPWIYLVGGSMAGLRIFTAAISIAAFVPFLGLGRTLQLRPREIALACALMAVNSYLIVYSYYLRPYSLLLFLTLCSHLCFIKFLRRDHPNNRRARLTFIAVNILLIYTHYFGWLAFAAQYLWVAFVERSHLRRMTTVAVLVLLSLLPWVGVLVYTSTRVSYTFLDQVSWETRPGSHAVLLLLRSFNGGFESAWLTVAGSIAVLLLIVLTLKYAACGARVKARQDGHTAARPLALLAWLTAFPVVFSLAAAYAFSWVWEPRYVIISIGPYLLLIAASALRLSNRHARTVAVAGLLAWSLLAGFTGDIAEALHGPNAPSYWLAVSLSRTETHTQGPIHIYALSPYAGQGLRLALNLTGERRFKLLPYQAHDPLPDDYFWLALTEHDPAAQRRVGELAADPDYALGEPLYSGLPPQRHILIPVQRR